jgi:hypothetical protein
MAYVLIHAKIRVAVLVYFLSIYVSMSQGN